jgi:DNA-directed RNA polymerase subunit RPC12/RpoP
MKMKEDKTTTYGVRLLCRNCNTDWVESVEKGTYVRCEKDNNYMIKIGDLFENRKFFNCPKCGTHTKIARLSPVKFSRQ